MKIVVKKTGQEPIQGGMRTMWVVDTTDIGDEESVSSIGRQWLNEFQSKILEALREDMSRER